VAKIWIRARERRGNARERAIGRKSNCGRGTRGSQRERASENN
jgi:hypothetical protein